MTTLTEKSTLDRYWNYALWLAIFTILYNLAEGLIAIFFGISDETLTLFGFGVDSFIEVMSGIGNSGDGAAHPPKPGYRPLRHSREPRCASPGQVSTSWPLGWAVSAVYNIIIGHKPETTLPGLIISVISIAVMWALVAGKRKVGRALDSMPILADANCTLVCVYMSVVLLVSSLIYELTGFGFVDSLGAIGLIYFSYNEGKEAFEKAAGLECDCEDENCAD